MKQQHFTTTYHSPSFSPEYFREGGGGCPPAKDRPTPPPHKTLARPSVEGNSKTAMKTTTPISHPESIREREITTTFPLLRGVRGVSTREGQTHPDTTQTPRTPLRGGEFKNSYENNNKKQQIRASFRMKRGISRTFTISYTTIFRRFLTLPKVFGTVRNDE